MTNESCHDHNENEHIHKMEESPIFLGKIREYWPLIVVILFAALMAIVNRHSDGNHWSMSAFMGYFLILLAMFKFFDLSGFANGFQMYDVFAKRIRFYAYAYPFIELVLGLCFLAAILPLITNVVTVVVMSLSAIGVLKNVLSGSKIKCVCLGTVLNVPLSTVSIVENGGMAIMAIVNIWMILDVR